MRAGATDISGVLPAALDQPRINFILRPVSSSDPYIYDDVEGGKGFNVDAYLDTGASGILISGDAAAAVEHGGTVGLPFKTFNGRPVWFEDVGVSGSEFFEVSAGFNVSVAAYHPLTDERVAAGKAAYDENGSFAGVDLSFYNNTTNNVRAYVSPVGDPLDPKPLDGVNVVGMPVMQGKVTVMDARPVNALKFDTMRTYIYAPGTPAKPATADTDPGIPETTRTVKLSYGVFDDFTKTGTFDDQGNFVPLSGANLAANKPTLVRNPFIGPNPLAPAGDTTPPVKLSFTSNVNGVETTRTASGSFLLDTGAAASIISSNLAEQLGVRYKDGTRGTDNPVLEMFDPARPQDPGTPVENQYELSFGGVGGTTKVAGFFLSSLLVRTMEGNVANDLDPKHFRFLDAPVMVSDINLSPTLALDGIFGMNFLVGTAFIEYIELGEGLELPWPVLLAPGAFDFAVFDEPNGLLKLRPTIPGDANRDGKVDFTDLVALAQRFDGEADPEDSWAGADFNGDGVVDFQDLVMLAQHYEMTDLLDSDQIQLPGFESPIEFGAPAGASAVPEPAGAAVVAAAVAVSALGRRRRRRRGSCGAAWRV
jgi:hypothetical protein